MIGEPPLLPVFLKMDGRPCLVIGAGKVALSKIENLLGCGAVLTVVSPEVVEEIAAYAREGRIRLHQRTYSHSDLDAVSVVIAATNDPELNHDIYRTGVARGRFVNVVDDPEYCDFFFGSIVRRGALQVAISTTGESPAFAQQLKGEIDAALPEDTGKWLGQLGELRRGVNRHVESGPARVSLLQKLARREICDPAVCPCRDLLTSSDVAFAK